MVVAVVVDDDARLPRAVERLDAQAFVPKPPVEALGSPFCPRSARFHV
jgi:hypothetical protein